MTTETIELEFDRLSWRQRSAHKQRLDTPTKPTPAWLAKELVYYCTLTDPRNAYYVVLRLPLGADCVAVSPVSGERVVRLLYRWADIEPHLHLPPVQLRDDVITRMATQGNILRAAMAFAAEGPAHGW